MVKPAGVTIPEDTLRAAFGKNPHGWGLMRLGRKGAFIRKDVTKFEDFLANYNLYKEHECAIHFRFRTAGEVDKENAHPYKVSDGVFMMHNGCIYNVEIKDESKSDTFHFSKLLSKFSDKLREPEMEEMLEMMVGVDNRFAFLDKEGIYVPHAETWAKDKDGVLYSNLYGWNPPKEVVCSYMGISEAEFDRRVKKQQKKDQEKNQENNDGNNKAGIPYNDAENYQKWWTSQLENLNITGKYDSEKELLDRDAPSMQEIADSISIDEIDRNDFITLCTESKELMAQVIYKTLQRM